MYVGVVKGCVRAVEQGVLTKIQWMGYAGGHAAGAAAEPEGVMDGPLPRRRRDGPAVVRLGRGRRGR